MNNHSMEWSGPCEGDDDDGGYGSYPGGSTSGGADDPVPPTPLPPCTGGFDRINLTDGKYFGPCTPAVLLPPEPEVILYDETAVFHDISESNPIIDIQHLFNCFSLIPDAGATYSIKLCADLPINYCVTCPFNITASSGHTFITLTKTNGSQSISQSVGFYPSVFGQTTCPGGFKDNGAAGSEHEYNSAITINNAPASTFNGVMQNLLSHQNDTYDIFTHNCTNVAVEAFNTAILPHLYVEPFIMHNLLTYPPNTIIVIQSPQKLYKATQNFNPNTQITKEVHVNLKAPTGHAPC